MTVIPVISKQMEQCPRIGKIVARWHLAIIITSSRIYGIQSRYNESCRCSEQILPAPWPFVISRFHCAVLVKATPDYISAGTKTMSDRASAHT